MASSENFENEDMFNDTEEEMQPRTSNESPNIKDKPLSPILSGGFNNRKLLLGQKLYHRKSARIKLSDKFEETDKEKCVTLKPNNIPLNLNNPLSINEANVVVDDLDKLEELENNRNFIYKALVKTEKEIDYDFKKPRSPASIKIAKNYRVNDTDINTSLIKSQEFIPKKILPVSTKQISTGFQTATGKCIPISESDIKKCSKLFDDIMYPTPSEGRTNKYTFLKKLNSVKENGINCNTVTSKDNKVQTQTPVYGFQTALGSHIKMSEKSVNYANKLFADEEFGDIKFETDPLKTKIQQSEMIGSKENEFSLTQAIDESEISNTQILHAVDNLLCFVEKNDEDDFRGFTKDDGNDSSIKHQCIERTLKDLQYNYCAKYTSTVDKNHDTHKLKNQKENNFINNKHEIDDFDFPPSKRRKICYENLTKDREKENNLPTTKFEGFSSASGKSIIISEKNINNAKAIFDGVDIDLPLENSYSQYNYLENNLSLMGFQKASGKAVQISEDLLKIAKNTFDKLSMEISSKFNPNSKDCQKSGDNEQNINEECIEEQRMEQIFKHSKYLYDNLERRNNSSPNVSFCKASGKAVEVSTSALNKAKRMFDSISTDYSYQSNNSRIDGQTSTDDLVQNAPDEYSELETKNTSAYDSTTISETEVSSTVLEKLPEIQKSKEFNLSAKYSKKKLGVSHCKQIQICDNKLLKAKLLFDEDFSELSVINPKQNSTYSSAPHNQNFCSTPVKSDSLKPVRNFKSFIDTIDITPIKVESTVIKRENSFSNTNLKIVCTSPTKSNWIDDLETERQRLENRLYILDERKKLGQKLMEALYTGKRSEDKKPRKGILYNTKTSSNKMSLTNFVGNKKPGYISANIILPISSKNAENLHFKDLLTSSITTEDGAIVIPNSKDMVGISEIKISFEAMPGVDPQLIPKGWIKNHYKWIVWKLASYENSFPNHFSDCLNIENVIAQLKYRYDREIDRAERSALRRIYEKDDAPQKRLILCVSDIKMLDINKYELELSDGWYSIRTLIDEPLCSQITKGKIEIGTKLLISGAELFNCDGCHPLETTNLTCLKINCNSTRRTTWNARLGFQRYSNPFLIQLQSIYPLGGTIPAIKICIVRVYPLKYMEKPNGVSVWRNQKAEEIAAQNWENERCKKLEQIQDEVMKKFESYPTKSDSLSTSQKEAVLNSLSNLFMKQQEEISAKINESMSKLKLSKRDVVALLKLQIIDTVGSSDKPYNFYIWRPSEAHLQSLKEGKTFTIQNVSPRPNGDISSNIKTTFKIQTELCSVYDKYRRHVFYFDELNKLNLPPNLNEFDTVGIVVQIQIETDMQEVWITDNTGRLLFIKINDGPSTCALLDNLKRGQYTTICNLVYCCSKKNIVQAVANHFTVFSSYPQHKHLQEGLEQFKKEIVDMKKLLSNCDSQIEIFKIISDIRNNFSANFEDCDEDTLVG